MHKSFLNAGTTCSCSSKKAAHTNRRFHLWWRFSQLSYTVQEMCVRQETCKNSGTPISSNLCLSVVMACILISSICMEVTPSTCTENVSKECLELIREAGHILELAFKILFGDHWAAHNKHPNNADINFPANSSLENGRALPAPYLMLPRLQFCLVCKDGIKHCSDGFVLALKLTF